MKPIFCLMLLFSFSTSSGRTSFNKLAEINKCWPEQKDVAIKAIPAYSLKSETEWIRIHLGLVEQTLRQRNTTGLTVLQKQNRIIALNHLHDYMLLGAFPQNEDYPYRIPIFIDKYNNFCAVGYLIKATGYEHISRMIASKTNLAYVHDMDFTELNQWATEFGFTEDELAWIQPTYGPRERLEPVGKGTNGIVHELYVDTATERLYVGGNFTYVDSTLAANNIGYVTEAAYTYTWHSMGAGVNGTVYAITMYDNKIFAGGTFSMAGGSAASNIAYWDGTGWNAAGCLNGTVKELEVFNGTLYAAGNFTSCNNTVPANFAQWTGTAWQSIPGITGTVNTMEALDTMLLIGGNFTFGNTGKNAAKWNSTIGFQPFGNNITHEVNDFGVFQDSLYAACTAPADSVMYSLQNQVWSPKSFPVFPVNDKLAFNTICANQYNCLLGGHFDNLSLWSIYNCIALKAPWQGYKDYFLADSTVNKIVLFKNEFVAGGAFRNNGLNGIGVKGITPLRLEAEGNAWNCKGHITGNASIQSFSGGRGPYKINWSTGDTTITLDSIQSGTYTVAVTDSKGITVSDTLVINAVSTDTAIQLIGRTLFVTYGPDVDVQWVDCGNNYAPIENQIYSSYLPFTTGSYAAIITSYTPYGVCIDTTRCVSVIGMGVNDIITHRVNAHIYPNPANDVINIRWPQKINASIVLTDMTGRIALIQEARMEQETKILISGFHAGIYLLKIVDGFNKTEFFKIIKE